jgi:hypothetical protein
MNRLCLERSSRSVMGASRSGVLAATFAAAILANSATWTVALAQQPGPVTQQRDEAPIGYVQPRMQDLPPSVAQDEKEAEPELDAIAKELDKLENRICRGCQAGRCQDNAGMARAPSASAHRSKPRAQNLASLVVREE